MIQVWVLRTDQPPMDAKRANLDDAVCGDCELRGRDGKHSGCYVAPWVAPHAVWKAWKAGNYPIASGSKLAAKLKGEQLRLTGYGDIAAVPLAIWQGLLASVTGWTAYTHSWRVVDPAFKAFAMASVTTIEDYEAAHKAGWRTFRTRNTHTASVFPAEAICPASEEAGHRTTCLACNLCRGQANPAKSVVIVAHGKQSNLNFFRDRLEASA